MPEYFEAADQPPCLPAVRVFVDTTMKSAPLAVPAGALEDLCVEKTPENSIRDTSRKALGNLLHAWFALEFGIPARPEEREKRVCDFCTLWHTEELWPDAEKYLFHFSDALRSRIEELAGEYTSLEYRTEEPVFVREEGGGGFRTLEQRFDLMVRVARADGSERWFLIDHKCGNYTGMDDAALCDGLARDYGAQMGEYLHAMRAMGRECSCWIHLPLEGRMLEFRLKEGEF